jgi:hypothetical protein
LRYQASPTPGKAIPVHTQFDELIQALQSGPTALIFFTPYVNKSSVPVSYRFRGTMATVLPSQMTKPYEDLYRQHARMVYRTAYGITGSHEDAEDVLQTIFLALVRREVPQNFAKNPEAYLHRSGCQLLAKCYSNTPTPTPTAGSRRTATGSTVRQPLRRRGGSRLVESAAV